MDQEEKVFAEAVINRLRRGAQIDAVIFSAHELLITNYSSDPAVRVYLQLASRWTLFDGLPPKLPAREEDLPVMDDQELARI